MILLSNPTSVLSLVTDGPQIVNVDVSWVDAMGQGATADIDPDNLNTQTNSATTTIISPPVRSCA